MHTRIAIIGGGLSGLRAAALLEERGIGDYVLLEARSRFGGRIRSEAAAGERFDLGATWYWPALQPDFATLVHDLGLTSFVQQEEGDMMIERSLSGPPLRVPGYPSSPPSMRIDGGMARVTDALRQRLGADRLHAGTRVTHIRQQGARIAVDGLDAAGDTKTWHADSVLLAVPPRLAAATIAFTPQLPEALVRQWQSTGTWMAPHAKYVAIYDQAFWRARGLSGEARSSVGPLGEIHDASAAAGRAALFGFFGIPAQTRASVTEDVLRKHCRNQLVRLFGPAAGDPTEERLKDWAADADTATAADLQGAADHAHAPPAAASSGPWHDRLVGIASEWSPEFPGYVAGAVDAARRGVQMILRAGSGEAD